MEKRKIDCLDKGFVKLVSFDASDAGICDAARVSYQKGTKKVQDDRSLIRYLLRHEHGTPFEMNFFRFHVKAPIFVFRQWHRHRVGISINELSARYSEMEDECYLPDLTRLQEQSSLNKQGSSEQLVDGRQLIQDSMLNEQQDSFVNYNGYLKENLSRELSRINLPVSTYSQMHWACNLRSLFNFIRLRINSHAQFEIQQYANALYELIKPIVPISCEAFEDYVLNAVTFSGPEMELLLERLHHKGTDDLKSHLSNVNKLSKRELNEFMSKVGIK